MSFNKIRHMAELGNAALLQNLAAVRKRIADSVQQRTTSEDLSLIPRLVCVTKTKPPADIISAYSTGERHFGENYVNEIVEKSKELESTCPDIKWHFIGHLQSNKINKVIACPHLHMIETIDTQKLADKVDKAWESSSSYQGMPLNVMIQINTSNEPQKSGIPTADICAMVQHVQENCHNLNFKGLMTIGSYSHDYSTGPNPDFIALMKCKEDVMEKFGLRSDQVEISMGMSNDFQQAIEMGSTNVRVGSTIFGVRNYPQKT